MASHFVTSVEKDRILQVVLVVRVLELVFFEQLIDDCFKHSGWVVR